MSRRIFKLIALTFVVAIALSGCNLVKVDETMDKAEVVATFNGGTVTKGEVEPAYQSALAYYEYLSSYYGYAFPTDGLLETTVDALVENKVQLAKAEELGMSLTAEEEAQALERQTRQDCAKLIAEAKEEAARRHKEYVAQAEAKAEEEVKQARQQAEEKLKQAAANTEEEVLAMREKAAQRRPQAVKEILEHLV